MLKRPGLLRARNALAGLEFALILPVMLVMLAVLVDVSLAVITTRRLTVAAEETGLVASTMAVQSASLGAMTGLQAWQATTAPFALFPAWRNPGANGFSITLSEVDFTAGKGGSYTANTRWSVANPLGQVQLRPCGALASVANGVQATLTQLPAGVFGPTSVLVADVSTVFVPTFTSIFTGPVTLLRSAYVPPRLNNAVTLSAGGPGQSVICPAKGS